MQTGNGAQDVRYHTEDRVGVITLAPARGDGRLTTESYRQLYEALCQAERDTSIGVVVITGEGNVFGVGGDFSAHKERTRTNFRQHLGLLMDIAIKIRNMDKPVIAAVNGDCIGGSNQLALLCDLTIASDNAKFGQHGVQRGTAPIFWGTQLLPRILGEKRAREFVYMCWEYTAQEAYEMGLVNKVVPRDQLWAEVRRWCDRLLKMSPRGLRIAKVSLNYGSDLCFPAIWHAREMLSEVARTEEFVEAVSAYEENRDPDYERFRE